jgi:hypothetical protein
VSSASPGKRDVGGGGSERSTASEVVDDYLQHRARAASKLLESYGNLNTLAEAVARAVRGLPSDAMRISKCRHLTEHALRAAIEDLS